MHVHFWNVSWHTKNGTSEIYKHIKPSKEERIQNVLHGSLACLMLCSAIYAANSAVHQIFTTTDECGTYQTFIYSYSDSYIAIYIIICMQSSYTVS